MNYTKIDFGKYRGMILPEVIFEDADYFFYAYEHYYFEGTLGQEAHELYRRSRSIWVPSRNGKKMLVQYIFQPNLKSKRVEFAMMKLIPDGSDLGGQIVSQWIDFYVPRERSDYDKIGYKNFVMGLKSILFKNSLRRMTRCDCDSFFYDKFNFDMDRVDSCDFCRMPWSKARASDKCLRCSLIY
jgi:hypothetical protein